MSRPLPARVSTVLFDLGNTLRHLDCACVAQVISQYATPVRAADVAAAEYRGKAAVDAALRERQRGTDASRQRSYFDTVLDALGVAPSARPAILAALHAENNRDSLWRIMHEDTPETLAALRTRGYRLGIVSNADGRAAAGIAAAGLADQFQVVIDSHLAGVEKPDPRIFHLALDACRAVAHETVFVGDIYEIDVQGARSAGIAALLLDPLGLYDPVDCERINSLQRLLEHLPARAATAPDAAPGG